MSNVNVQNKNTQKRYDFPGTSLPTDWNVLALGAGMTVSVSNSELVITTGTTASAETVLRCTKAMSLKFLAKFILKLSQRIANQEFRVRVTNESGDTYAEWLLDGTVATTGKFLTANGGVANAATSMTTLPTTASYINMEIAAELEQVFFNAWATNTSTRKAATACLDRLTLNPDENYYLEIKATNLGVAPASSTTFSIDAVLIEDLTMLGVEILRASGDTNQATLLAQWLIGGTLDALTTVTTANCVPKMVAYADTTTILGAGASYVGTTRDLGATPVYEYFRAFGFADQAGTLYIDQSTDGTEWFPTDSIPVTAGTFASNLASNGFDIEAKVVMRYVRVRYVNGGVAQTAKFKVASMAVAM